MKGTGKTLTSIAVAGRGYLIGKVKKLLILCPSSVMSVWPMEFEKYADFPFECKALDGSREKRIKEMGSFDKSDSLKVAVINYESSWRLIDELLLWNADMIIADEAQRIKGHNTSQSKAAHKLGDKAKYKLALTGTPIQNSPLDFWSIYRFVDKAIFGTSFYGFKNKYAVMGGYGNYQIISYKNLDDLTRKAHSIAYRVTKKEALDLPEEIEETLYIELEAKARKIYENVRIESYAEIEKGEVTATNILIKLLRLQQITGGFLKTDDGIQTKVSTAKLDVLKDRFQDLLAENKKAVIFAKFTSEIKAVETLIKSLIKDNYIVISGETPIKQRGDIIKSFQENEQIKICIAQLQTAGVGITLHSADTAIFYSLDYNYANFEQAKSRIHRIGQKNNCTYIYLVAKGTIDEKIIKALDKKEDIAKRIVDNWRDYIGK